MVGYLLPQADFPTMWPFHRFDARAIRSQQPYWLLRNGIADATPALTALTECDVVIVGAGITGALVADELCDGHRRVVVIDHRDMALGSTSASTALLQYEIDKDLTDLTELVGDEDARLAYLAGIESIEILARLAGELEADVNFARRKSLYLASRRSHLDAMKKEYAARAKAGIAVEWLDQKAIAKRFDCHRPGAILSATAAQMDPFRMTRALLARSVERGAQVFGFTTLEKLKFSRGEVRLILASGARINAAHVIICCGYESLNFLPMHVADLHSTYALVTQPTGPAPHPVDETLIWDSDRPYVYLRGTPDRRLLIGGEDMVFRNASARDAILGSKVETLKKQYASLFKRELPPVDYSWAGTFAETKDGLPFIGAAPGTDPRLLFALCFGGNGITFSAHAGAMLRATIEGRTHPLHSIFGFERLTRSR
jgi:glycine/D-amino acid oxidase-like deaminating enzyme